MADTGCKSHQRETKLINKEISLVSEDSSQTFVFPIIVILLVFEASVLFTNSSYKKYVFSTRNYRRQDELA